MPDTITIKQKESSHDVNDYQYLYNAALARIQQYSGKVWTDYNLHDPGVTILENLCYGLTELGYRSGSKVLDILADPVTHTGPPMRDTFFSPATILPSAPLTPKDFRKLLLEVKGVKNARVYPSREMSDFKGIFDVDIVLDTNFVNTFDTLKEATLPRVLRKLHNHRNLCEDIHKVNFLKESPIKFDIDFEVNFEVDTRELLNEITFQLANFLSPTITMYGLDDLLQKGMKAEQIYNGPLPHKGFILDEELEQHEIRKEIHTSDLINFLMDIPGVEYVRKIKMIDRFEKSYDWNCKIEPGAVPVLDLKGSSISLLSSQNILVDNHNLIKYQSKILKHRSLSHNHLRIEFEKEEGKFLNLDKYYDLQSEFPEVYGVGPLGVKEHGVGDVDLIQRRGRAMQLKGYLMPYEQLLANHFAQLANVKQLFSIDPIKQTYFYNHLLDLPKAHHIYRPFLEHYFTTNLKITSEEHLHRGWQDFLYLHKNWVKEHSRAQEWKNLQHKTALWNFFFGQVDSWYEAQISDPNWKYLMEGVEWESDRHMRITKWLSAKRGDGSLVEFDGDQLLFLRFTLIYENVENYLFIQIAERERWEPYLEQWKAEEDTEILQRVARWVRRMRDTKSWRRYFKRADSPKKLSKRAEKWLAEEAGPIVKTFSPLQKLWALFMINHETIEAFETQLDAYYETWHGYAEGWKEAKKATDFWDQRYGPVLGWTALNADGPEWNNEVLKAQNGTERNRRVSAWVDTRLGDPNWNRMDSTQQEWGLFCLKFKSVENYERLHIDVEEFHTVLSDAVEDEAIFNDRRNRALDHMLARFGIDISEYSFTLQNVAKGPREIMVKQNVLHQLPELSANRNRGADLMKSVGDPHNRSGLENRLNSVLGIVPKSRRFTTEVMERGLELIDQSDADTDADSAFEIRFARMSKDNTLQNLFSHGLNAKNYEFDAKESKLVLSNRGKGEIARLGPFESTGIDLPDMVEKLKSKLNDLSRAFEGMHFLEHVHLRPFAESRSYTFSVHDSQGDVIFESKNAYTVGERAQIMAGTMQLAIRFSNYRIREKGINQYKIVLKNANYGLDVESLHFFSSFEEAQKRVDEYQAFFYKTYLSNILTGNMLYRNFTKVGLIEDPTREERLAELEELGTNQYNFRIRQHGNDEFRIVVLNDIGQALFEGVQLYTKHKDAKAGINDISSRFYAYNTYKSSPSNQLRFIWKDEAVHSFTCFKKWGTLYYQDKSIKDEEVLRSVVRDVLKLGGEPKNFTLAKYDESHFEITLKNARGERLFISNREYTTSYEAEKGITEFVQLIEDLQHVKVLDANRMDALFKPVPQEILQDDQIQSIELFNVVNDPNNFEVKEENGQYTLLVGNEKYTYESRKKYNTLEGAETERDAIVHQMQSLYTLNLSKNDKIVQYRTKKNYLFSEVADPYSFIISVVLPKWPARFQEQRFRTHVQNLIYREVPAHIAVNLRWFGLDEMLQFEDYYHSFLTKKEALKSDPENQSLMDEITELADNLLEFVAE